MKFEVAVTRLAIREGAGKDRKIIGFLHKFDVIESLSRDGDWIQHGKGWSLLKENNQRFLTTVPLVNMRASTLADTSNNENNTTAEEGENPEEEKHDEPREEREGDIDYSKYSTTVDLDGYNSFSVLESLDGIHGIPYSFMSYADSRYGSSKFGRKYTEKILARMPLLLLTPGEPEFMDGYSSKQKSDVLTGMVKKDIDGLDGIFDSKNGKLYSFKMAYDKYWGYVNAMLQNIAINLGIGDVSFKGKSLKSFEWQYFTNEAIPGVLSSKEVIAFYLDSDTQIQETFNNGTGESQLSSAVNGLSDMAQEIQFLLGGVAGSKFQELQENMEGAVSKITDFTSKYSNIFSMSVVDKLMNGFEVLVGGGKMAFPEIWKDSDFSRSYDVSIKLRTPDADKFSIYLNILAPIIHLVCLTAPRQLGTMGYQSPFLVRGFYKGFFNMDMGIITSLNITRGDKSRWTSDGLPTEVDITISMKDLYQVMFITSGNDIVEVLNNTMQMDYLANLCGININTPDIQRAYTIWYNQITNWAHNKVTFNGFIGIENALSNIIAGLV